MGLLSRLWNLNTRGTTLQEPLKSMIDSKKYKTMDIIGYLKSVLEDAKPYARMKLMIVGVQGIGKTSLLEQLRQEGTTRRRPEVGLMKVVFIVIFLLRNIQRKATLKMRSLLYE